MTNKPLNVFLRDIFKGPLTFLLHLIYKSEIQISDISIQELTRPFLQKIHEVSKPSFDSGTEFIGITALLLWMKSKILLPQEEKLTADEIPDLNTLYQLVEYSYFKNISRFLSENQNQQSRLYSRGKTLEFKTKKNVLGIENLSLADLSLHFQNVVQRNKAEKVGKVYEEEFRVGDQIQVIKSLLYREKEILFCDLFDCHKPKKELIANFLALLELLKLGTATITNEGSAKKMALIQSVE